MQTLASKQFLARQIEIHIYFVDRFRHTTETVETVYSDGNFKEWSNLLQDFAMIIDNLLLGRRTF